MSDNIQNVLSLFKDQSLKNGFTSVNDAAKKHQLGNRIMTVLRMKNAIIKIGDKNFFSPDFDYSENFAKKIIEHSAEYKRFQDQKDTLRKQFEKALLSTDTHPHELDDWWQIIGYAQKKDSVRVLESLKFLKSEVIFSIPGKNSSENNQNVGRPKTSIRLTNRAFAHFCMVSQTFMGMVIRDFFYDIREELEQLKKGFLEETKHYRDSFDTISNFQIEFAQFVRGIKQKDNQVKELMTLHYKGISKLSNTMIDPVSKRPALFEHNANHQIEWNTFLNQLKEGIGDFLERIDTYIEVED